MVWYGMVWYVHNVYNLKYLFHKYWSLFTVFDFNFSHLYLGNAFIYDLNIKDHLDEIRTILGVCPQVGIPLPT